MIKSYTEIGRGYFQNTSAQQSQCTALSPITLYSGPVSPSAPHCPTGYNPTGPVPWWRSETARLCIPTSVSGWSFPSTRSDDARLLMLTSVSRWSFPSTVSLSCNPCYCIAYPLCGAGFSARDQNCGGPYMAPLTLAPLTGRPLHSHHPAYVKLTPPDDQLPF
jgi:hypothetical protein